jgi:hypothetical protein
LLGYYLGYLLLELVYLQGELGYQSLTLGVGHALRGNVAGKTKDGG